MIDDKLTSNRNVEHLNNEKIGSMSNGFDFKNYSKILKKKNFLIRNYNSSDDKTNFDELYFLCIKYLNNK